MEIIRGDLSQFSPLSQPLALTLGNFDGLHRGHLYLLEKLVSKAGELQCPAAALFFEPHPVVVLNPQKKFERLQGLAEKLKMFATLGLDTVFIQDFSVDFAAVSALEFLQHYISNIGDLSYFLVGYDFRFGKNGEGDFSLIKKEYSGTKTLVAQADPFQWKGVAPSSTLIREHLKKGDIQQANDLLGRKYEISGTVGHGQALGRTLGAPTANLTKIENLLPAFGVYFCEAEIEGQSFNSVANIGIRPSVPAEGVSVEVHLLDFDRDIYGKKLILKFCKYLRGEKSFPDLEALKLQINNDIMQARQYFFEGR